MLFQKYSWAHLQSIRCGVVLEEKWPSFELNNQYRLVSEILTQALRELRHIKNQVLMLLHFLKILLIFS